MGFLGHFRPFLVAISSSTHKLHISTSRRYTKNPRMVCMKRQILIVEDEFDIASALRARLENEGFKVILADNGPDGLALASEELFHLIILDVMLPGFNGIEFTKILRKNSKTPILMLSAKDEENDIIAGLQIGADDYVTKPFSIREVVARVENLLKRIENENVNLNTKIIHGEDLHFENLDIETKTRNVYVNKNIVHLTPNEFQILYTLCAQANEVFSRESLCAIFENNVEHRTIDSHIRSLRKKIGSDFIRTVHGIGYAFEPNIATSNASNEFEKVS
jgi:DNA-binding response OmpR family regulator